MYNFYINTIEAIIVDPESLNYLTRTDKNIHAKAGDQVPTRREYAIKCPKRYLNTRQGGAHGGDQLSSTGSQVLVP